MRVAACLLFAASGAAMADIRVVDDTGRTVHLNRPAERIVTLSPHATELVFAAGAGARLVAVAAYSDQPPAARRLPRIGGAGGLDRERLLAWQPDLVVAWGSGSRPADLAWLQRLGIAVYRSEPRDLGDIAGNLRDLGRLGGSPAHAAAAAARLERDLASVCPGRRDTATVVYRLWEQPLLTYGGRHWSNDALRRVGLRNLFEAVDRAVFTAEREAVLAGRPDYLLSATASAMPPTRHLPAAPALDRPTPRIVGALRQLCATVQRGK